MKNQLQSAWDQATSRRQISGLENVSPNYFASASAYASYIQAATNRGEVSKIDPNTYWAPSVNARAVVLIDYTKQTVTIIMHGDIDG